MKKVLVLCLSMILVISLFLVACASSTPAPSTTAKPATSATTSAPAATSASPVSTKIFEWKLTSYSAPPAVSLDSRITEEWAREIEKTTGGRLKITCYWSETLGKSVDFMDMLDKGMVELATSYNIFYKGRFPIDEFLQSPFLSTGGKQLHNELLWDLLNSGLLKEYEGGMKILMWLPLTPNTFFFKNKQVANLEDMKGLKIRATGPMLKAVELMGASPVAVNTPDLYMSLERGIIDGLITDITFFNPNKLYEVAKYSIRSPAIMGATRWTAVNRDKWNSLSPDVQSIVTELSLKYFNQWLKEDQVRIDESWANLEKQGVRVYNVSADEATRWKNVTKPVTEAAAKDLQAKGLPVMEVWEKALAKHQPK